MQTVYAERKTRETFFAAFSDFNILKNGIIEFVELNQQIVVIRLKAARTKNAQIFWKKNCKNREFQTTMNLLSFREAATDSWSLPS